MNEHNIYAATVDLIKGGTFTPLNSNYTEADVDKFIRQLRRTLRKLMVVDKKSPYKLLDALTACEYEEVKHPGELTLRDDKSTPNKDKYMFDDALKIHTIQQAAIMAVLEVIEAMAPDGFLDEIKDDDTGLENCTVLACLDELKRMAEPTVAEEAEEVLDRRDVPLAFGGDSQSLKIQFMDKDKQIKTLKDDHEIGTSMPEFMLTTLLQIKRSGIFTQEALDEWDERPSKKKSDWKEFKEYWIEVDRKQRSRVKKVDKAGDSPYHSAANVENTQPNYAPSQSHVTHEELETVLANVLNSAMTSMSETTNKALEQQSNRIDEELNMLTQRDVFAKADKSTTPSSDVSMAFLLKKVEELQAENTTLKKKRFTTGGDTKKWWGCDHCGRNHHPNFDPTKCYLHPKNANKSPENGGPPAGFTKLVKE